jgi:hypothetical protein
MNAQFAVTNRKSFFRAMETFLNQNISLRNLENPICGVPVVILIIIIIIIIYLVTGLFFLVLLLKQR